MTEKYIRELEIQIDKIRENKTPPKRYWNVA